MPLIAVFIPGVSISGCPPCSGFGSEFAENPRRVRAELIQSANSPVPEAERIEIAAESQTAPAPVWLQRRRPSSQNRPVPLRGKSTLTHQAPTHSRLHLFHSVE